MMEQKVALYKTWCFQNIVSCMGEILMTQCCETRDEWPDSPRARDELHIHTFVEAPVSLAA